MNVSNINNTAKLKAAKIYAESAKKTDTQKSAPEKSAAKASAPEKGGVTISRAAKGLSVIGFAADRVKADMNGEVSAERVGALRNLIKSGNYRVGTDALVSALVNGIGGIGESEGAVRWI